MVYYLIWSQNVLFWLLNIIEQQNRGGIDIGQRPRYELGIVQHDQKDYLNCAKFKCQVSILR